MNQYGYIGRKMRVPALKKRPAIIIALFGSSSRARDSIERLKGRVEPEFSGYEIFWAYTSRVLCKKMGLPTLQETLAEVEAAGFRKAVVQPLHVFPGTEYQQMAEICSYFPGMRVFLSETLLHRWDFVKEVLAVLEPEFLSPKTGLNILALHGTPLASEPVNVVYMGIERLVCGLYTNVLAASVEGLPDFRALLNRLEQEKLTHEYERVKIIPMMYLAGLHAEEDLMGGENSWRSSLEDMGFKVECPSVVCGGVEYFKGLAWYPGIVDFFMERLARSLTLAQYY